MQLSRNIIKLVHFFYRVMITVEGAGSIRVSCRVCSWVFELLDRMRAEVSKQIAPVDRARPILGLVLECLSAVGLSLCHCQLFDQ